MTKSYSVTCSKNGKIVSSILCDRKEDADGTKSSLGIWGFCVKVEEKDEIL